MPVLLPNDIENETPADAVEVEQNFNVIEQYTNTSVITRDGTVAMAAPLQLFGDPLGADDAVRKSYVDALLPVGIVLPYAGITVPAGKWASCNGASLQTAVYPKLFQVTGYRFGGSGGNFLLPDMRGRFPIGMNSADTRFNTTGDKGGSFDVPVPYHRHGIDHNHPAKTTSSDTHSHPFSVQTGGQSQNHWHGVQSGEGGAFVTYKSGGPGANIPTGSGNLRTSANTTDYANQGHTHHVDGPTGTDTHSHTLDLSLIDAWSAYAGTSGVDHVPPYLTVFWVIRVD